MGIKFRLTVLNFLEFFIWGSWLISAGTYMSSTLGFSGVQIGSIFATMGIVSLFMPAIVGVVADKWIRAERLLAISLIIMAVLFMVLTEISDFNTFYFIMFLISLAYMPTLALNNSISFHVLEKNGLDTIKHFPPIRVWGTIGFILAAWCVDFLELKASAGQFYITTIAALVLALYALTLPKVKPVKGSEKSWRERFGLDALVLFKQKNTTVFLIFSVLLGTALQITNIWGVPFLDDFKPKYPDSFAVKHSVFLMTLSQIAEVFFILTIPFFLKRFGIKKVVLMSMLAWALRFGLFGIGSPEGIGLFFLVLSMIVYGMAFDFFFVSGSLYMNKVASSKIRSSAQGLFMVMTSGFGWIFGGYGSGLVIDLFTSDTGIRHWKAIWFVFASYALVISIMFAWLFKYRHKDSTK
ncbi:nucleoside permease [Allomuricauda sp. SCSIO 65647]|uniref:nucleoside permease n=1 Tax=Allomuricauda sp. SCSIO 65647 TaxID=2908843 RepID=UPI001F357BAA|nr:nucleoside permease [Muricauda sp. SCSIO 65647]UJH67814.1 nucleoside permease [Muricauda sp. SCSIO 65647]